MSDDNDAALLDAYQMAFADRYPYDPNAMEIAFQQARKALCEGEAAIGCALVEVSSTLAPPSTSALGYGRLAATGHNLTNAEHHALAHAEFVAMRTILSEEKSSATDLGSLMYVLYVTVEPCIMCASMLAQSGRVAGVYFGCRNPRFGGNGTVLSVHKLLPLPHRRDQAQCSSTSPPQHYYYPSIGGMRAEEAVGLLQNFYSSENQSAPEERRKRKPAQ